MYKERIIYKIRFDYIGISQSNMNTNFKLNIKNDLVKVLAQCPVANDGTVSFLHQ